MLLALIAALAIVVPVAVMYFIGVHEGWQNRKHKK